jgi:hypothetical protein
VDIHLKQLKDVEVVEGQDGEDVTLRVIEKDGSPHGALTEIKIPAKSYEMFEGAIAEKWLEKQKANVNI